MQCPEPNVQSQESRVQRPEPSMQRPEFSVHSPTSRVQRPGFRVQHLEFNVQSPTPECSVQSPASSVQSSTSRVQRPTLASRVQEFRYADTDLLITHLEKTFKNKQINVILIIHLFDQGCWSNKGLASLNLFIFIANKFCYIINCLNVNHLMIYRANVLA